MKKQRNNKKYHLLIVISQATSCLNLSGSRSFTSSQSGCHPCPSSTSRTIRHALSSSADSKSPPIRTTSGKFTQGICNVARFRWLFFGIVFCGLTRWFNRTEFPRLSFRVYWIWSWVSFFRWPVRASGWEERRWPNTVCSTRGSRRSLFRGLCCPSILRITEC